MRIEIDKEQLKMKITVNPKGAAINQYLMKIALLLGGYFIIEYMVHNYSATNILFGLLNLPMMAITVILVYCIIRNLRDKLFDGKIAGFIAWTFGVQLMFFAGLIEAAFIYVYNEFIVPTNLVTVHDQLIAQYEEVLTTLETTGIGSSMISMMQETIELLKQTPVASAIETAITMLSNDIFYGMIIMTFLAPIIRKK